jgi:hypothetical protein
MMVFLYNGFTVHRLAIHRYLVTGPGSLGLVVASVIDAVKIIDGIVFMQCGY